MSKQREKGPIEILCAEIGEAFDRRLERPEMLLSFVGQLVSEVAGMMDITSRIAGITGQSISEASAAALAVADGMVRAEDAPTASRWAEQVHDIAHMAGEETADRPLEMLSACASAIRFGLEMPCRSRHAADAAQQIWANKYGVSLFDRQTLEWQHQWVRGVFHQALASSAVNAWDRRHSIAEPTVNA